MSEPKPVADPLRDLSRHSDTIGTEPGAANQEAQGYILATLEKPAFRLEQDQWAISHGVANPLKNAEKRRLTRPAEKTQLK